MFKQLNSFLKYDFFLGISCMILKNYDEWCFVLWEEKREEWLNIDEGIGKQRSI